MRSPVLYSPRSLAPGSWRQGVALLAGVAVALGLSLVPSAGRSAAPAAAVTGMTGGTIVATYGVGGVLKSDGVLYQWRPEQKKWVTLDESFKLDGESRKVMPLPVRSTEVIRMEGFGFLVTRSGTCWLYNLDTNQWENIGRP